MNASLSSRWLPSLLIAIAIGLIFIGASRAQEPSTGAGTERIGGAESTAPLVEPGQNSEGTGPAAFPPPHPSAQSANLAIFYRRYAGLTFVPRDSDQRHDYGSAGCIQGQAGGTGLWVHSLDLPDGAELASMTLYFYDADAGADVTGWITRFDNQGATEDLVNTSSASTAGFGTATATITHVVDNANWSYVLYGRPGSNGSTTRFCGIGVRYSVSPGALRIPLLYGDD